MGSLFKNIKNKFTYKKCDLQVYLSIETKHLHTVQMNSILILHMQTGDEP